MWIVLFGSLIGLNETLLGGMHMPNKSIVLSVITLLFLSVGRYLFPKIGTSLLMTAVAVLFKITDLGIYGCKVEGMVMLGVAFEIFASLMIRQHNLKLFYFSIVSMLAALATFVVFALIQRYVFQNEYWYGPKFTDHIFIKGPITAVASAVVSFLGVLAVKPLISWYNDGIVKNPYITHGSLGLLIAVFWVLGYFTV